MSVLSVVAMKFADWMEVTVIAITEAEVLQLQLKCGCVKKIHLCGR